jgi:hypothetical protein
MSVGLGHRGPVDVHHREVGALVPAVRLELERAEQGERLRGASDAPRRRIGHVVRGLSRSADELLGNRDSMRARPRRIDRETPVTPAHCEQVIPIAVTSMSLSEPGFRICTHIVPVPSLLQFMQGFPLLSQPMVPAGHCM